MNPPTITELKDALESLIWTGVVAFGVCLVLWTLFGPNKECCRDDRDDRDDA